MLSEVIGDMCGAVVRFSEATDAASDAMLASACEFGLEGIIGKQVDAPSIWPIRSLDQAQMQQAAGVRDWLLLMP
ncbi:hypothetical protein [Burkholderia cenocepacia]|uniref:hypothetical protein n=1 Tax=Burkholderia cenocepacia TaxID=95486 RepID=UPI002656C8B4|nr:hypothetical protein [Burkholderia cenocepacia]MDN7631632.1 hypothetical protein [Burkholderia cenocepacia]